jgi:hypothetical protein
MKNRTISECLSDAGFSCRHIPISEHAKLEKGINDFVQECLEAERERLLEHDKNLLIEFLTEWYSANPFITDERKVEMVEAFLRKRELLTPTEPIKTEIK